jgi:serine/threonine protein kinase
MHSWSYDMWSLGAILLEIVSGFPIWMSLKCRTVPVKGRSQIGMGILGVQGRCNQKIYAK